MNLDRRLRAVLVCAALTTAACGGGGDEPATQDVADAAAAGDDAVPAEGGVVDAPPGFEDLLEGLAGRVEIARRAGWGGVALWALGYEDDDAWASLVASSRQPLAP